jgi:hypothetical protein
MEATAEFSAGSWDSTPLRGGVNFRSMPTQRVIRAVLRTPLMRRCMTTMADSWFFGMMIPVGTEAMGQSLASGFASKEALELAETQRVVVFWIVPSISAMSP